jgi:hypothetical protein
MWSFHTHPIDPQTFQTTLTRDNEPLSFRSVLDLWQGRPEFRTAFSKTLAASPFEAFFWETPPVTDATLDRPFEFVVVEGRPLMRLQPDSAPFKAHFASAGSESVLTFPNLGGDALLVVPVPVGDAGCYTHLGQFLRHAPTPQIDAFWRCTGQALAGRVSASPTWLSTAGLGVSWLHLRLDSRPKYYRYAPYKTPGASA